VVTDPSLAHRAGRGAIDNASNESQNIDRHELAVYGGEVLAHATRLSATWL
jgi:hypothetical protein